MKQVLLVNLIAAFQRGPEVDPKKIIPEAPFVGIFYETGVIGVTAALCVIPKNTMEFHAMQSELPIGDAILMASSLIVFGRMSGRHDASEELLRAAFRVGKLWTSQYRHDPKDKKSLDRIVANSGGYRISSMHIGDVVQLAGDIHNFLSQQHCECLELPTTKHIERRGVQKIASHGIFSEEAIAA